MRPCGRAIALAGTLVLAASVLGQRGGHSEAPDVILARARRRLSRTKTYKATIVTRTTVGRGAATTSRLTVRLQTGRKAHVLMEPLGVELWHDGKSLVRYDRRANVYSRLRANVSSAPLTPLAYVGLANGGSCRRVRTETAAKRHVEVLLLLRPASGQGTLARATTLLHVDAKTYRVLRYRQTAPGQDGEEQGAPSHVATSGEVISEVLDAPIPDAEFVFRAPRGARLENSGDPR